MHRVEDDYLHIGVAAITWCYKHPDLYCQARGAPLRIKGNFSFYSEYAAFPGAHIKSESTKAYRASAALY